MMVVLQKINIVEIDLDKCHIGKTKIFFPFWHSACHCLRCCLCLFSFTPKGNTPLLHCLSSVHWATIIHIKLLGLYGCGQRPIAAFFLFKSNFLTILHKTYLKGKPWKGGGGGSTKTHLAPLTERDEMTSTLVGRSCDLRVSLTGGRLYCATISPVGPTPSPNKTIHKQRKGA